MERHPTEYPIIALGPMFQSAEQWAWFFNAIASARGSDRVPNFTTAMASVSLLTAMYGRRKDDIDRIDAEV